MSDDLAARRARQNQRHLDLGVDSLSVLVGTGGALAALAGHRSTGLVLLALGVLVVVTRVLVRLLRWRRSPLGSSLVARSVTTAGTAVLVAPAGSDASGLVAAGLATAVVVGGVALEPYLRRAARFSAPVAANLPGVEPAPPKRQLGPWVSFTSLGVVATGLVLAAAGVGPWWWSVVSLCCLVPSVLLANDGRARIQRARRLRTEVPEAVAAYAPEFVVYTSRPDDASYQVAMWLPYLQRTGRRFVVITRNGLPARALAELTDVPVVEARRVSDLDALVPPSLRAAFYVNASSGNGVFVRYQHLTHVYLGHGDSDKPPSYNPTHAMYDRIFAAGPAAARRYAAHGIRIPADKFQIVGRPQVEGIRQRSGPAPSGPPVVLYAPTWRGHVEETMLYSLPSGERIVSALLARGATVVFRPHPFSYDFADDAATIGRIQQQLAADARRTGREHRWGAAAESEWSILDCINASTAMVSDVSSVVSDYLFSGKPFAMVAVPAEPAAFVEEYPVARAAYVVRGDLADLDDALSAMLGVDPLARQREAIRVDYLGDFPAATYADAFVDAVGHVTSKVVEVDVDEDDTSSADETPDTENADAGGADAEGESEGATGAGNRRRIRRLVLGVGSSLAAVVLAAATLTAALLPADGWVTLLLTAVALVVGLRLLTTNLRNRRRWYRLLNRAAPTRAVLVVSTAALLASTPGHRVLGAATVVALLATAWAAVGETHVRSAWGRVGLEVQGFPELRAQVRELVPRGLLALLSGAALLGTVLLAVLGAPTGLVALPGLLLLVVFGYVLTLALVRAARVIAAEGRLREALVEYAPEFAIYFASTVGAAYQVGMWLPFLARLDRRFVVVTRSVSMMREIARVAQAQEIAVPVIHRPTLRSLEDVIVGSMTTAFYVNNAVRNTHFVERRELTHVWLNHGDSEKPACFNPVHAIYDLLFAAGQAGIDRYASHGIEIPAEKFRIVGRPQVESVQPARPPAEVEGPRTVLYAPTWQGPFADTRVYSLPMGREIVEHLLGLGVRVVFRAHPFNYRFAVCVQMIEEIGRLLDADREATGRQHLWGPAAEKELTVEECFNLSDAMISDVSAVVSDYLQSEKPFAIVSVGRTPEVLLTEAPAARAAYLLRQDLGNLDEVCSLLLGADPLAEERLRTKIYYLGSFGAEDYADGFLRAANRVIDAGGRPAEVASSDPATPPEPVTPSAQPAAG